MNVEIPVVHQDLDFEWIELISIALEMGLTEREIRQFLEDSKPKP